MTLFVLCSYCVMYNGVIFFLPVHCIRFNVIMSIFIRYFDLHALEIAMNSRYSVAIFAQHWKLCVALWEKQCCLCLFGKCDSKAILFIVMQKQKSLALYGCSLLAQKEETVVDGIISRSRHVMYNYQLMKEWKSGNKGGFICVDSAMYKCSSLLITNMMEIVVNNQLDLSLGMVLWLFFLDYFLGLLLLTWLVYYRLKWHSSFLFTCICATIN